MALHQSTSLSMKMKYAAIIFIILCISSELYHVTALVGFKASSSSFESETITNHTLREHEFLVNCTNVILSYGEYQLLPDGTLHVEAYDVKLNKSSFVLWNGSVTICKPNMIDEYYYEVHWTLRMTEYFLSMSALLMSLIYVTLLDDLKKLINGTYMVLATSLILLTMHVGFMIYNETPDCGDFLLRYPAMNHFFILTFFFWLSALAFDGIMLYKAGKLELKSGYRGFTLVNFKITIRGILVRLFMVFALSVLLDRLEITSVSQSESDDFCEESIKGLFIYLLRPVVAYSIVSCLNFMFSHHILLRQKFYDETLMLLKNFYDTHFTLFLMVVLTWLMSCISVVSDVKEMRYFIFCLQIFQICIFLIVLPFKEQFEKRFIETFFRSPSITCISQK